MHLPRPALSLALPLVLVGLVGGTVVAPRAPGGSPGARAEVPAATYVGITRPSKQFALAFSNLGKVSEVGVEPGDRVEAEQVLMRQEDALEQARLEELRAEADVQGRVETAIKQADLAEVQKQRQENLFQQGAGNQLELEEARLNFEVAKFQIDEERRQGLAAAARVKQLEVQLRQKALRAPAAGVIRAIEAQQGEIFGPQEPAAEMVVLDPLTVEVLNLSPETVAGLRRGSTLEVRYDGAGEWLPATVSFIDPVASAEVDEQLIELDLPNPNGLPAGLEVEVRLADDAEPSQADAR